MAVGPLVNIKIPGKWMFIHPNMVPLVWTHRHMHSQAQDKPLTPQPVTRSDHRQSQRPSISEAAAWPITEITCRLIGKPAPHLAKEGCPSWRSFDAYSVLFPAYRHSCLFSFSFGFFYNKRSAASTKKTRVLTEILVAPNGSPQRQIWIPAQGSFPTAS